MLVLRRPRCRELSCGEAGLRLHDPRGCACARRGGCDRRLAPPPPPGSDVSYLSLSLLTLRCQGCARGAGGARSAVAFLIGGALGRGRGRRQGSLPAIVSLGESPACSPKTLGAVPS